jgi:hypothetical protein
MTRLPKTCAVAALLSLAAVVSGTDSTGIATVQFRVAFPDSNPAHYEITVQSHGHCTYTSDGELGKGATTDSASYEFTLSDKTRQEIFDLAKRAHYFSGKVDSGNTRIANMGAKTLTYKDASHNTSATYNYSTDVAVQQITSTLQNLSTALEYGRRLTWFHKYQKLALEQDLKQMEERQREGTIGDVQAIVPILRQIADDQSVMRITRARALRFLALTGN